MANWTCGDPPYAYLTIQAGIDAIPGNLSGNGREHVQVSSKAAGYAEEIDAVTGFSNASATDYVDIQSMVSHGGLKGGGIVVDLSGATNLGMTLGNHTTVNGFCFTRPSASFAGTRYVVWTRHGTIFKNNIIYGYNNNAGSTVYGIAVNGSTLFYNNQIINQSAATNANYGIIFGYTGAAEIARAYNSSVVLAGGTTQICFAAAGGDYIEVRNNYAYAASGAGSYAFQSFTGAHDYLTYNISSDATADDWGGTGNLINKASSDQFVSVVAGSEILYPKRGSFLLRDGADMSAYLTRDCRGLARIYEDEPYFTTGAIHVPPARVVANLTNRRGNLRPNCYHETI